MLTEAEAAYLAALRERRARITYLAGQIKLPEVHIDLQPHQIPPTGDWVGWLLQAGRRAGKSYACAAYVTDYVRRIPVEHGRMRLIAPTFGDAVESCVKGPSGLLALDPSVTWHPTAPGGAVLRWPNKMEMLVLGTNSPNDVDRLRATGGRSLDWFEEAAANRQLTDAFAQAELGRNLGPRPRWIASTTPRPIDILKEWQDDDDVVITRAVTHDNKTLTPAYLAKIEERYAGTRLYRQEVLGEIVEDVEGALWTIADIQRSITAVPDDLVKVVVGVDPPSGAGTCGIVVVGADKRGHVYVLEDYSITDALPNEWATVVVRAAREYDALIVAEKNQGGRMVTEVIRGADPAANVTTVNAAVGKRTRAEPISLLWEAEWQSGHMCPKDNGHLGKLFDQLTGWVPPGEGRSMVASPDRLDAMVWACAWLRSKTGFTGSITSPARSGRTIPRRDLSGGRNLHVAR